MKLKTFCLIVFCTISICCFSQLKVRKDGSVKIGQLKNCPDKPNDQSVFKLDVNGTVYSTGNWQTSDFGQEWESGPIDNPLDQILKINGQTFAPVGSKAAVLSYGFNAQDVKSVFPCLVHDTGNPSKPLAINYDGFIPLLLGAIREQQKMIDELRRKKGNVPDGENSNQVKDFHFTVKINLGFPDDNSPAKKVSDSDSVCYDQAILKLPNSYSVSGAPTRLVYYAHGAGSSKEGMVTANSWFPENNTLIDDSLLANGYAIFDVNGGPIVENMGGSWVVQSVYKAYEYIQRHYNVDRDIFVIGLSMGGLSSTNFVVKHSNIVLAHGMFCPVLDLYGQAWEHPWYQTTKKSLARVYNFNDLSGDTWEPDKVVGWNPLYMNTFQNAQDTFKIYPVPVKIWHSIDDKTVNISGSRKFQRYIHNANGYCGLRELPEGGHGLSKGTPDLIRELILFFRRFDK